MKKATLFLFLTIACLFTFAQQNDDVKRLVNEGIQLHDKGDYDGAIKKYDEALQINKDDFNANYEKSFSCLYAKKYDDCIAISKYLLDNLRALRT